MSKRTNRSEVRRKAEEMDLIKKSARTGRPVSELRKPKHSAKAKKKQRSQQKSAHYCFFSIEWIFFYNSYKL